MKQLRAVPTLVSLVSLYGLTGAHVAAQSNGSPDPFTDVVSVEVVNVDVVVVDRDGQPVVGLSQDDFEIFEDGQPREISNFYASESSAAAFEHHLAGNRVADAESPTGTVRRIALLFDANSLTHRERNKAIEAAKRFVAEKFDGSYEWSVIAFDDQVRILQPFTADKYRVESSLERVKDLRLLQRRRVQSTDSFLSEDPASTRAYQLVRSIQGRTGLAPSLQDFEVRQRTLEMLHEAKRTALAAVFTMRSHARLSGRKSLILVSGALESLPSIEQLIGRSAPGGGQSQDRSDPMLMTLQQELAQLMGTVVQTANASNFSIYPISALVQTTPTAPHHDVERRTAAFLDSFDSISGTVDTETAPRMLADGTGGVYFQTSKFYEAFHEVDSRTSNTYVLGFRTVREPDRKYHRIRVEVRKPGLTAKAREGYLHLSAADRVLEELSTPLVFPKERGDIPVTVSIAEGRDETSPKDRLLSVHAAVPVRDLTLVPQGEQSFGRVQVVLGVYDEHGNLLDLVPTQQDIRVEATMVERVLAEGENASFKLNVRLKPGTYTLSLTLMDEVSSRFGTTLERVEI